MRADAAEELRAIYLRVTEENVRTVYADNREELLQPVQDLPEGLRRLLTPNEGAATR